MIEERFIQIYEDSFRQNWDLPALTDYNTKSTLLYKDLAEEIAKIHILLRKCGIKKGDKIALVGKNTPQWCIAYMATITYGAVLVPILQDFNPQDICHIVNHSDSVLLFINDSIWTHIDPTDLTQIRAVISIDNWECLFQREGEKTAQYLAELTELFAATYPAGFTPDDIVYADNGNEELAVINYTSGTTGFSKGVMLTGNNLAGNVTYARTLDILFRGERELCFLPLAHAYSCAFNFLVPMAFGAHVYLLGKLPSPKILLKAFADVKPHLILTVPLILEKIYKKMLLPVLSKRSVRIIRQIPGINRLLYRKIRQKLTDALGGNFREVIVGGAAMNQEVADFLYEIRFPFTIGYGMTECGPLISYDNHREYVLTSCGQVLKGIMQVRIDSEDPYHQVGEIQVRGENVMKGYYKNEEATRNAFTEDGWLKTGDLGTIDAQNRIYIRGRSKTMLLSSNGQNIYPEEIESKLNNLPFVLESLILEKEGKLVGLVYPDFDAADRAGISVEELPALLERTRLELNKLLAPYEAVSQLKLYPNEFEKTPKKSIKRFLYTQV